MIKYHLKRKRGYDSFIVTVVNGLIGGLVRISTDLCGDIVRVEKKGDNKLWVQDDTESWAEFTFNQPIEKAEIEESCGIVTFK